MRGFDDKQALLFPGGDSVFRQPDPGRTDGNVMLPFRMDTHQVQRPERGRPRPRLEHRPPGRQRRRHEQVGRRQGRAHHGLLHPRGHPLPVRARRRVHPLRRATSVRMAGPTDPNRLYLWTGTAGPGKDGTTGPWTDNTPLHREPGRRLDDVRRAAGGAGVSWRVYHNPSLDERYGDYDDNALAVLQAVPRVRRATDPRYINAHDQVGPRPPSTSTARTARCRPSPGSSRPTCSANTRTPAPTTARTTSTRRCSR